MKRFFTALFLTITFIVLSQNKTNKTNFYKLVIEDNINIVLENGEKNKIIVEVDSTINILEEKGILTIFRNDDVKVVPKVTCYFNDALKEIETEDNAFISSTKQIVSKKLKINVTSSSVILNVKIDTLYFEAYSSSYIKLSGTTNYLDLYTSSKAKFHSPNLLNKKAKVIANYSSSIKINAIEEMNVEAKMFSDILYNSNVLKIFTHTFMGGSISSY